MKKAILAFILTMAVASQIFSDEIDEVRELLAKEKGGDILYLSKRNLGFPGGDNWIANRDRYTYVYSINKEKKVRTVHMIDIAELSEVLYWFKTDIYIDLEYDILQGISGIQLGSKAAKFGDYNGDGKDEIFVIGAYAGLRCFIWGYDSDKGEEKYYFQCRYDITSSKEPAPFFFTNYKGKDGILIHFKDHIAERYMRGFFAWDNESQKYIKLLEIEADKMDWSMFDVVKNENSQIDSEPAVVESDFSVAESQQPEDRKKFSFDDGKDSRFIFYIGIAVGVIALSLAVVFAVRRKKG